MEKYAIIKVLSVCYGKKENMKVQLVSSLNTSGACGYSEFSKIKENHTASLNSCKSLPVDLFEKNIQLEKSFGRRNSAQKELSQETTDKANSVQKINSKKDDWDDLGFLLLLLYVLRAF